MSSRLILPSLSVFFPFSFLFPFLFPFPLTTHLDGTACPEGTQRTPRGYHACCPAFDARTRACYHDIRYEWWSAQRNWFVLIAPDAGGGGIAMVYCPHCGAMLKGSGKNGRYMNI